MKKFSFFLIALIVISFSLTSQEGKASHCSTFSRSPETMAAFSVVAKHLKYSEEELCEHVRISAIQFSERIFYNQNQEPEDHRGVTLHYGEYSCQYFVRKADQELTRSNCYNTW